MNEDLQKQFVSWLAQKLQARDEQDLKAKMQHMGSQGIKQAYQAFMQEQQAASSGAGSQTDEETSVPMQKSGGKLDYIRCLQAFKKGGKMEMDKCGCGGKMQQGGEMPVAPSKSKDYVGKMKKHQQGGTFIPLADPNRLQVEKADGTVGPWGHDIPTTPVNYPLHPTSFGPQEINERHLDHLRKVVPGFDKAIGNPISQRPGEVAKYGPDQSDMLRKLMVKYPMAAPQVIASRAKGGKIVKGSADHSMGKRTDTNTMVHNHGSRKDPGKKEHAQGSRSEKGFKEHSMGMRTNGPSAMQHKESSRSDQNKMGWQFGTRKEDNKKKKDYVGFGRKGMKVGYQDGGDMEMQSQKKGGKVTAADQKVIDMKKKDAMKHQMGGSLSQPAPTPDNASKRMAGKSKGRRSMQPASLG